MADHMGRRSGTPREPEATSLEEALGHEIRTQRHARKMSIRDLAEAAGLSTGMVSRIENGQISASLSTVRSLALALDRPFTSLFDAYETKNACSYVPSGTGELTRKHGMKGGHVYQSLGGDLESDIVIEPYLITLEAKATPYAGFRHSGIELIYMLSGELIYRHADTDYRLRPGDSLLFDSSAPHGPERLLERPMTYLSIISYPKPER